MTKLIFGADKQVAEWVASKIPGAAFGPNAAVGMASPSGNKFWGGVVFHDFIPSLGLCSVSIAAVTPRWATPGTVRAILSIPFEQYQTRKLYATIRSDNARSMKLCAGLGFTREATLRHHFGHKIHGVVFSLMAVEYMARWGMRETMKEAA